LFATELEKVDFERRPRLGECRRQLVDHSAQDANPSTTRTALQRATHHSVIDEPLALRLDKNIAKVSRRDDGREIHHEALDCGHRNAPQDGAFFRWQPPRPMDPDPRLCPATELRERHLDVGTREVREFPRGRRHLGDLALPVDRRPVPRPSSALRA
jgi:hypothetical protein